MPLIGFTVPISSRSGFMRENSAFVAAEPRRLGGSPRPPEEVWRTGEERFTLRNSAPIATRFRALCVPMVYIGKRWAPLGKPEIKALPDSGRICGCKLEMDSPSL